MCWQKMQLLTFVLQLLLHRLLLLYSMQMQNKCYHTHLPYMSSSSNIIKHINKYSVHKNYSKFLNGFLLIPSDLKRLPLYAFFDTWICFVFFFFCSVYFFCIHCGKFNCSFINICPKLLIVPDCALIFLMFLDGDFSAASVYCIARPKILQ